MEDRPVSPCSSDVPYSFQARFCGPGAVPAKQEGHGDSEPILFLSSTGTELDSLKCDEDGSSLESNVPVHRDTPGAFVGSPAGQPDVTFDADDVCEVIRNELSKLQSLRYVPEMRDGKLFADCNRPRIVAWLVQVVTALDLTRETLHCAVSLLDRFIAGTEAHPPEPVLQLLALGCLSAAAKHEEVAQRSADEWVSLAVDNERHMLYESLDLHRMEWLLLETVDWRVRVPNTLVFLRQYYAVLANRGVVPVEPSLAAAFKTCAELMAEVSMLYSEFLSFGYSTVAVACLTLADWSCQCFITAGIQPHSDPERTVAGPRSVVCELAAFVGLDLSDIAPNLDHCVATMRPLHRMVTGVCPWGRPPGAELGLLAPVVARYRNIGVDGLQTK